MYTYETREMGETEREKETLPDITLHYTYSFGRHFSSNVITSEKQHQASVQLWRGTEQ